MHSDQSGVIAVDQDPLGYAAREVSTANGLNLLARPLSGGNVTVVLFNETAAAASVITTSAVGAPRGPHPSSTSGPGRPPRPAASSRPPCRARRSALPRRDRRGQLTRAGDRREISLAAPDSMLAEVIRLCDQAASRLCRGLHPRPARRPAEQRD
jgi:hypothetical protein